MTMRLEGHVSRPDRTRETRNPASEPIVRHMTPEEMDAYLLAKYGRAKMERSEEGSQGANYIEPLGESRKRVRKHARYEGD